ncbi:extracellular solute-binding protein [Tolumonas osonensis]|uniref:Multiple sugar transport system substrate-binding protein n=1 Tax=Tolumonas osonensis TaxID=675874 RepID=A0A841GLE7_9GAMM|nr:extracellular solute-binding protein [Tolumonas osonensis]MBB6056125.1 multiple sugar transport system substrate-binding protein [Tolumonas osonensis]
MKHSRVFVCMTLASLLNASSAFAATQLHLQRFFGACDAEYGKSTDVSAAEGECGIMTTLINKFSAEHPDIEVKVSTVEWPGYDQLTAQMASRTPPDLVTMHNSVIADYQSRELILPIDDILAKAQVDKSIFTSTAQNGVVRADKMYGLPIDTWTMLYHINTKLMKQAGLMDASGKPILPTTPDELLKQARQFKQATGKPYFVQILSNETAAYARLFYTYLFQQGAEIFKDPTHIQLRTPEAKNIVSLFKQIYDEGLTTKNMDYPATVSAFSNGEGGILLNGNWLLGTYDAESHKAKSALYESYAAMPYPQLYKAKAATYVDGHSWVMPNKEHSPDELAAIGAFYKFMAENDFQWSRTGHLPSVKAVLEKPEFQALPQRTNLMEVTKIGTGLPSQVERQFAIQDIIGEELAAAITGAKEVDAALADAESRVNEMLANL